jgi:bidirectional [NiFe] hydrogenase diaphorase subunit
MELQTEMEAKEITLKIDGKDVKAKEGATILDVAREVGIDIPTLCYHKALAPFGACRVCSVEIVDKRGRKRIVTSCNYPVEEGLIVYTQGKEDSGFGTRIWRPKAKFLDCGR